MSRDRVAALLNVKKDKRIAELEAEIKMQNNKLKSEIVVGKNLQAENERFKRILKSLKLGKCWCDTRWKYMDIYWCIFHCGGCKKFEVGKK